MRGKDNKRPYAQLVVDFANSKTTDDAVLSIFKNCENIFNFSPTFYEEAKREFPFTQKASLSENEVQFLGFLLEEAQLINVLQEYPLWFTEYENRRPVAYNSKNKSLIFHKYITAFEDRPDPSGMLIPRTQEYGDPVEERIDVFIQNIRKQNLKNNQYLKKLLITLKSLKEVGNRIKRIVANIPASRRIEISEKSCYSAFQFHALVAENQGQSRVFLDEIVNAKDLRESKYFVPYLSCYNSRINKAKLLITNKGLLQPENLFREEMFTVATRDGHSLFQKHLEELIAYAVVESFGRSERHRVLLKKCHTCSKFYLPKTMQTSFFCSNQCRLALHNKKRTESGQAKEYKRKQRKAGNPAYF